LCELPRGAPSSGLGSTGGAEGGGEGGASSRLVKSQGNVEATAGVRLGATGIRRNFNRVSA